VTVAPTVVVSAVLAGVIPPGSPLDLPGRGAACTVVALVVMAGGLVLRLWAVTALGPAFRTTVEVDDDQAVVDRGPYRVLRHPAYAGALLVVVGFGVGAGTWVSLALCLVVPVAAFGRRIVVEERELGSVLGAPYRNYARRTRRLVPGVW
jgi:protein-S-isoprenylcysteine O-methyltransferase Ste14